MSRYVNLIGAMLRRHQGAAAQRYDWICPRSL